MRYIMSFDSEEARNQYISSHKKSYNMSPVISHIGGESEVLYIDPRKHENSTYFLIRLTSTERLTFKFTLPVASSWSCDIDWGDGTIETKISPVKGSDGYKCYEHTYSSVGEYEVELFNPSSTYKLQRRYTSGVSFSMFYGYRREDQQGTIFEDSEVNDTVIKVIVSNDVTSIGVWCMIDTINLTHVYIPKSVTTLQGCPFVGANLEYIYVEPGNPICFSADGILYTKRTDGYGIHTAPSRRYGGTVVDTKKHLHNGCFWGCEDLKSYDVPEGVVNLGNHIFYGCKGLERVTLPSTLKTIGSDVNGCTFYMCESLKSINLPEGLERIENLSFTMNYSLESIDLPSTLKHIGYSCFNQCTSLKSIDLPSSLTSIEENAFWNCNQLAGTITIPEGVTSLLRTFGFCESLEGVVLPSTLTSIGEATFINCASLRSITIPEGVTNLDREAFYNCSSLEEVVLPSTLTSIGTLAFQNCSKLTSINIPESVTSIDVQAFCYSGITNLYIPSGVTTITEFLAYACPNLTTVTLPEGLTTIGSAAFCYDPLLSNVNIPSTVTSIDTYAFFGCGMSDVVVPEGVTTLTEGVFAGCESLTSISIPSTVVTLDKCAVQNCPQLSTIKCYALTAPTTTIDDEGKPVFNNAASSGTLHIKPGATDYDAWLNAGLTGWTIVEDL